MLALRQAKDPPGVQHGAGRILRVGHGGAEPASGFKTMRMPAPPNMSLLLLRRAARQASGGSIQPPPRMRPNESLSIPTRSTVGVESGLRRKSQQSSHTLPSIS